MSAPTDHRISDPAARVLAEPQSYADEKKLHEALAHLRKEAPVSWVEVGDYRPFWAITKHADIMDIERQNDLFTNFPRPLLAIAEADDAQIDAETALRLARAAEQKAATRANLAALTASTLHRALETLDEIPRARLH